MVSDNQKILDKISSLEKQVAFLVAEVERMITMLRQGGLS